MPAETAQLSITVTIKGSVVSTSTTAPGLVPIDYTYQVDFSDGTGNNQLGTVYQSLGRALNATSETLDMDGLSILGVSNTDANAVKFIMARHKSTTASELMKMGGGDFAASTGPLADSTDKIVTGPDGLILLINPRDGWSITATSKDGLLMELTGNSTYDTIIGLDNS